jgi:hypothetical protein
MRMDGAAEPLGGSPESALRSGGFIVVWLDDRPSVRLMPGERLLDPGAPDAVVAALADAPRLLSEALGVRAPGRPWDRLELTLRPGSLVEGEALSLGSGCIRISVGEDAPAASAAGIARHEALHLLLAGAMRGGQRWCDPELAFPDWIVRGMEGRSAPSLPRFRPPWPGVLEEVPRSRLEVQRRLRAVARETPAARRYFGEVLFSALQALAQGRTAEEAEQEQLWLVEAALGTHYLETAARLWTEEAGALRPILLDDWLIDYEQYARGLANAPRGAGHIWRISEGEWSRDPVVRLSVAAQALQRDDHFVFAEGCPAADALVWKNRGCVRLPLVRPGGGPRPPPVQGFRAALRGLDGEAAARALAAVEEAAREAEGFEARALWPRILARLLACDLPWPEEAARTAPAVQIVDGPEALAAWSAAADALRSILGERGAWVPRVLAPRPAATLARAPPPPASILLVHGGPPSPASLLAARELAARMPVRGALFSGDLGGGAAWEQLPDLEEQLDPRYREEPWQGGEIPARREDLPRLADEATRGGRPLTPLAWLLALGAIGLEECHYPRAPSPAPPAGHP